MLRTINTVLIAISLLDPSNSLLWHQKAVKTMPDGVKAPVITMAKQIKPPDIQPIAPLAPKPVAPTPQPAAPTPSGSHTDWMIAAGISPADFVYVDYIVSHESSWDPCSYYPGQSNCAANPSRACGLVMQNPCHKIPGDWRDPVAALVWMKGYVSKYGGFGGAYNHWLANHSY